MLNWLFTFASKQGENRTIACGRLLASDSGIDCVFTEAADGVMLEVGSRRFVLRILEATHATRTYFAFGGSASEKVAGSILVDLEGDIRFEKRVDR